MSKYWALYKKELKAVRAPFLLLIATYLFLLLQFLLTDMTGDILAIYGYREMSVVMIILNMLVFSGAFIYSFYEEKMNSTSHQLLTLSIPRYAVMLSKFLAFLSVAIVAAHILGFYSYIVELKILVTTNPGNIFYEKSKLSVFIFISRSYSMLCVAAVTTGVLSIIKRYRFMSGIFLFTLFYSLCSILIRSLNSSELSYLMIVHSSKYVHIFPNAISPLIAGSILLPVGLYVFHKYCDI